MAAACQRNSAKNRKKRFPIPRAYQEKNSHRTISVTDLRLSLCNGDRLPDVTVIAMTCMQASRLTNRVHEDEPSPNPAMRSGLRVARIGCFRCRDGCDAPRSIAFPYRCRARSASSMRSIDAHMLPTKNMQWPMAIVASSMPRA
jgi:hypothetical protein